MISTENDLKWLRARHRIFKVRCPHLKAGVAPAKKAKGYNQVLPYMTQDGIRELNAYF
jgi:hypothetical protein